MYSAGFYSAVVKTSCSENTSTNETAGFLPSSKLVLYPLLHPTALQHTKVGSRQHCDTKSPLVWSTISFLFACVCVGCISLTSIKSNANIYSKLMNEVEFEPSFNAREISCHEQRAVTYKLYYKIINYQMLPEYTELCFSNPANLFVSVFTQIASIHKHTWSFSKFES